MNWTEVTINTTNEAVEAISGVLYTIGVGGVTIEDNTLLEEANRNTARWDVLDDDVRERYSGDGAVIKAYFSPDKNMEEVLLQLGEGIERAKESDVPIHRDDKLANTLSKLDIGDMIPPELYEVVAEILVFVDSMDKLKGKLNQEKAPQNKRQR